jgi:hypothetical protein
MSLRGRWPNMRRTSHSTSAESRRTMAGRGYTPGVSRASLLCAIVLLLSACLMPGDAARVLKIGLIAPFEGLGRPLGYAVLPAVQEIIGSANAGGELGPYRLLLVALNDDLDPAAAAAQAEALAQDPAVIAVIGPFTVSTAAQAAPVVSAAGIPVLVAAPFDQAPAGVFPLCPGSEAITSEIEATAARINRLSCSDNAIDADSQECALHPEPEALSEASSAFGDSVTAQVYWPGDAAEAAAWLVGEQQAGSARLLIGGPDVLKPWFVGRAGEAGEGTRAIACSLSGSGAVKAELPEVALARGAAERIVHALAASVQAGLGPTREQITVELDAQPFEPTFVWYQVIGGEWQPVAEP